MAEIRLRFATESYNGSRIIDIDGFPYKTIYATRADLPELIKWKNEKYADFREIFCRQGIYILKSLDGKNEKVYIGKANDTLSARLQEHNRNDKIGFTEIVAFIGIDNQFPINTEYVEARLIEIAKKLNNAKIENNQQPRVPKNINATEKTRMEKFVEYVNIILPIAGFTCLKKNTSDLLVKNKDTIVFTLKNYDARMVQSANPAGFYVLKGSKAKKNSTRSLLPIYKNLKKKYINDGILVDKGDHYKFAEDTLFQSPSSAASVVLGSTIRGTIYWVNKKDNDKTWKDYQ